MAKKIILLFVPVLVLTLLTPGLYFVTQQKQVLDRHFDERMNLYLDYAVQDLQALPGSSQKERWGQVADRLMSQEDVVSCRIRDVDGYVIMERGREPSDNTRCYSRSMVSGRDASLKQTAVPAGGVSTSSIPAELSLIASTRRLHEEKVRSERVMSVALLTSLCFALLFFGLTVATMLARPLRLLVSGMNTVVQQGDLCHRILMDRDDEFGELASAFNQMTDELKQIVVRDRDLETVADYEHKRALVLDKANKDLDHINKELCDFAHIISHDLKAPLRGIRSLTDWIVSDYGEKFDEEGKTQLGLLSSRVERMEGLIDGILEYSKAGQDHEVQQDVDLNRVVADVIEDLAPPKHIHISIKDTLPVVHLQKTKITQAFQNLISNAIKYNDKPIGIVSVHCRDQGDFLQFSVVDNGPGIDPRYYEKIFNMFETLSSRDQADGTGVGLAVVKRIIEGWGGRIWVRSRVGEGSIFVFTLLKQIARADHEKYQTSVVS